MRKTMTYPNIDMMQTGLQLKAYMNHAGMSVRDIQMYLHLSCPQPIYRWISGKVLPSVDHLLMLSELFGVHMEELLVKMENDKVQFDVCVCDMSKVRNRIWAYWEHLHMSVVSLTECI